MLHSVLKRYFDNVNMSDSLVRLPVDRLVLVLHVHLGVHLVVERVILNRHNLVTHHIHLSSLRVIYLAGIIHLLHLVLVLQQFKLVLKILRNTWILSRIIVIQSLLLSSAVFLVSFNVFEDLLSVHRAFPNIFGVVVL